MPVAAINTAAAGVPTRNSAAAGARGCCRCDCCISASGCSSTTSSGCRCYCSSNKSSSPIHFATSFLSLLQWFSNSILTEKRVNEINHLLHNEEYDRYKTLRPWSQFPHIFCMYEVILVRLAMPRLYLYVHHIGKPETDPPYSYSSPNFSSP